MSKEKTISKTTPQNPGWSSIIIFTVMVVAVAYILSLLTSPVPLSTVPQNITHSLALNTNEGALTMSITFSHPQYINANIQFDMSGKAIEYEKYTINNASLTLANGTTIIPAPNFVKKEFDAFCANIYSYLNSTAQSFMQATPIEYNCS